MVIIIHSAESKGSIADKIGGMDYSYYFVLKKYRPVLEKFAFVIEIRDPASEADAIYQNCQARGEPCLFLSFTPPFKTAINLQCPTISVFAWEYLTLPTDAWGGNPRHDWRTAFRKHGYTITHSSFAVQAVQKAMGENFPVWSIPAPVWDDYTKLYRKEYTSVRSKGFDLTFEGVLIDFQGCNSVVTSKVDGMGYLELRSSSTAAKVNLHLEGIIYTSVFNPNDGRKNWLDLLWAFCWAFRDVEDVTLVMKLAYYDFDAVRELIISEIKKLAPFKCRVVALHGFLNNRDYEKLIQESTYVVNTAYGEGQCLPLMEYMSAGKPAIAPSHTAMEDYVNHDNAFVVNSSVEWTHWPHDSRSALRTFRYRINWESLYHAYQESYAVAKNDPGRYLRMSRSAVESLKMYCSKAVAEERLKMVFQACGMFDEGWLIATCRKTWRKASGLRRLLQATSAHLFVQTRSFLRRFLEA